MLNLYNKSILVINSCETFEQREIARRYVALIKPICYPIWNVISNYMEYAFEIGKKQMIQPLKRAECPDCLATVIQEELDTFGGVCEECYQN